MENMCIAGPTMFPDETARTFSMLFLQKTKHKVKDLELRSSRKRRHHSTKPNATTGTALWYTPAMLLILKILSGVKTVACESDHRPSSRASINKSPPYGLAASSAQVFDSFSKEKCTARGLHRSSPEHQNSCCYDETA